MLVGKMRNDSGENIPRDDVYRKMNAGDDASDPDQKRRDDECDSEFLVEFVNDECDCAEKSRVSGRKGEAGLRNERYNIADESERTRSGHDVLQNDRENIRGKRAPTHASDRQSLFSEPSNAVLLCAGFVVIKKENDCRKDDDRAKHRCTEDDDGIKKRTPKSQAVQSVENGNVERKSFNHRGSK